MAYKNHNDQLEAIRRWKKENPEKVKAQQKRWRKRNPDYMKEWRAQKHGNRKTV